MACCVRRPPRTPPPPAKRYASTLEVKPKAKATPYSASELSEYAWGNQFQHHQRIGESVIEKEKRIFRQLSSLGLPTPPAPPPRPRLAACCCCCCRRRCCGGGGAPQTYPEATEGMLIDALDAVQAAAAAAPPPPVAATTPKPDRADEDEDAAAASPGEEVGSSFAPGGRAKEADPKFNGVPKRVAKKELFQNERARLLEDRLAFANRTQGLDTPMQRERDLAAEQAKERQQAMIEVGEDPFATPPRPKTVTPLMRQRQIEAEAQARGYEGTDGHESRVAFLVAAREGWTAARPYETSQSPLKVLQLAPPPPRPADWVCSNDLWTFT